MEVVDADLVEDKEYALLGSKPANRVEALLGKLKAARRSKERAYNPSKELIHTTNRYVRRVEKIFIKLSMPQPYNLDRINYVGIITFDTTEHSGSFAENC